MEPGTKESLEKIVRSIAAGIGADPYVADTSAVFSCPQFPLGRDYSKISEDLAGRLSFFYEMMLGVVKMDNLILPPGVRGKILGLLFEMRGGIMNSRNPCIKGLDSAARMMQEAIVSKARYSPSPGFEALRKEVNRFKFDPLNYALAERCGSKDTLAIAVALDLASVRVGQVGILSRNGYQLEFMAKAAKHLKIPIQILTYDSGSGIYRKRDYETLGRWDSFAKAFVRDA